MKKIACIFLTFFICGSAFAAIEVDSLKLKLLEQDTSSSDSLRSVILLDLAEYYYLINDDEQLGDSLSALALSLSELKPPNYQLAFYNRFYSLKSLRNEWNIHRLYLAEAQTLLKQADDPRLICQMKLYLANFYLRIYNPLRSENFCNDALKSAYEMDDKQLIIKSKLALGSCYDRGLKKVEAFRQYANAVTMAEELGDVDLMVECYDHLANFYRGIKVDEKAKFYLHEKLARLRKQTPIDSNDIVKVWIQLEEIDFNTNFILNRNSRVNRIFRYTIRKNNNFLRAYILSICRSNLITSKRIDQLEYIYRAYFPEELGKLKQADPINFLRLKGLLLEFEGDVDSAYWYFDKVEKRIKTHSNKALIAKFYIRYGEFLERQNQIENSLRYFQKAYNISLEANVLTFALEASTNMERVNLEHGAFKKAYSYSQINRQLYEQISNLAVKDDLLKLEIDNTRELQDLAMEKQKLANQIELDKAANRSYLLLGLGVGFLLLIIGLYSRLRYTRRTSKVIAGEKEKSDQLLLNILPQNVAEELKENGYAKPHEHQNVVVLFSDFVDFTPFSSKYSPAEIVGELNSCFKEFDQIIRKYNLEKIKTIGDAYLAVSGLYNKNTPPDDAINAGLEMQAFMKRRRQAQNDEQIRSFEMRVGIHVGPVISGIVGMDKFQFDVWGDTVNIASRMETLGIKGTVNISKETYNRIKTPSNFNIEERGYVEVKGKGKLEMFSVLLDKRDADQYSQLKERSQNAQHYILNRLKEELSPKLSYHTIHHTLGVIDKAKEIARYERLSIEEVELLAVAAAFHDSGLMEGYDKHEERGCRLVEEVLPDFGFSPYEIGLIQTMILSTKVPQVPVDKCSQILCDADLFYLGGYKYSQISATLREELENQGTVFSEEEWLTFQIKFLESHHFWTHHAIKFRSERKSEVLKKLIDQRERVVQSAK